MATKMKKFAEGDVVTAAPLSKRDRKEAFREQMRTYRQGDRLGPRPIRPEFNRNDFEHNPAPITTAVAAPATTTPAVAAPATTAPVRPTTTTGPTTQTTTTGPTDQTTTTTMKKGGKVKSKCMSSGGSVKSSASRRADGIATKGKTKGRII
jgi:hypothetical protein